MLRYPLKQGDTIELNNKHITVDSVLGDGATCIVYSAYYKDNMGISHRVNIKECYPFHADITRNGQTLVWSSENEKSIALKSFRKAYQKLMAWQNSFVAHAFDIYEANETLYILMDKNEGITFDKDKSDSLTDILKTVRLLAYAVGNYHKNGYLHLDIKPSNFLVYPRPSEHIILFDLDTVTSIDDIKSGNVKCIPYSDGWAAPEQKQGKITKLCPATDIYAIGAVLFEKIMGRRHESFDSGTFTDWDFDGVLFENINPKIKRLLREIFHKSVAANRKRRYQNIDELIKALDIAIKISEEKQYLISDFPYPNKNFLGREKELSEIRKAFDNNHVVFLHGFGGIGKSESAKQYAAIHESEYDAILFLRYENSLSKLIENIEIQNCDLEAEQKNKILRKMFNSQKVLLIVDNFDVDIDGDEYLERFLSLRADIIFTTRTDFSVLSEEGISQIEIGTLSENSLTVLFEKESGIHFESEEDRRIVKELLREINYYTLLVPILARQLTASGFTLKELYTKLKNGLNSFANTEKIAIDKDNKILKLTALDMMRVTFRISQLPESYLKVLLNLYFLRYIKINKRQYRKYFSGENTDITRQIDVINDLIQLGWIQKESDNTVDPELTLHAVTVELLEAEFQPNIWHCRELVEYVNLLLPWYEFENEIQEIVDDWDRIEQDRLKNKIEWFCAFACSFNLNNSYNAGYVTDVLYRFINGNLSAWEIIEDCRYVDRLVDELEKLLENAKDSQSADWAFKIANVIETKWAYNTTFIYVSEAKSRNNRKKLDDAFYTAKVWAEKTSGAFRREAIMMFCKPIAQISDRSSSFINPEIISSIKQYKDIYGSDWDAELLGAPIFYNSELIDEIYGTLSKDTESGTVSLEDDPVAFCLPEYIDLWKSEIEINIISNMLENDGRLTNEEKEEIYGRISGVDTKRIISFGFESSDSLKEYLVSKDWNRTSEILKAHKKFILNNEDELDADFGIMKIGIEEILVSAIQNDFDKCKALIDEYADSFKEEILSFHGRDEEDWIPITKDIYNFSLINRCGMSGISRYWFVTVSLALSNIEKENMILHDLEEITELIWKTAMKNAVSEGTTISEEIMYEWYDMILIFADRAYRKSKVIDKEQFLKIENKYKPKMYELTGRDFSIIYPNEN